MAWWSRKKPERRDAGFYSLSPSLGDQYVHGSGVGRSEGLAAVASCVGLISSAIAALPVTIVQQDGTPAPPTTPATRLLRLLRRPSEMQSWPSFMQWYARQLLVFGNAVARVDVDARGAPTGLTPVRWDSLFPRVLSGPKLAFDVANRSAEAQLLGLPPRLFADECLFCRLQSDDGVVGRSPIARAAAAVREGITLSDTAAATFRNGARPSGVLTFPTFLSDIQRTRYADTFIDKISVEMNAGRVPVLEGGMKLEAASMTFLDAQFLEMRGLNTETVCNLFNVPSILIRTGQHAVADLSVYTTAFYQQAVVPLIAIIEAEFDHSIFDDSGLHLAIDADGAMRGSFSSMVAALAALQQSGSITANEVRAELDWPPIEGGDALAAGNAPNWPADGAGMPSLSPKPGPTGDAPPKPGNHGNEGAKANGKATIQ